MDRIQKDARRYDQHTVKQSLMKKNLFIAIVAISSGIISCNPGPGRQDRNTESRGANTSPAASGDSLPDRKNGNGDLDKSKDESQQGNQ